MQRWRASELRAVVLFLWRWFTPFRWPSRRTVGSVASSRCRTTPYCHLIKTQTQPQSFIIHSSDLKDTQQTEFRCKVGLFRKITAIYCLGGTIITVQNIVQMYNTGVCQAKILRYINCGTNLCTDEECW